MPPKLNFEIRDLPLEKQITISKEIETMFRVAASRFGIQVNGSFADDNLSFGYSQAVSINRMTGHATVSEDPAAKLNAVLFTNLVNRFIAGKAEPELEITCNDRGDTTFRFLAPGANGTTNG